jgi:hypothetical protein
VRSAGAGQWACESSERREPKRALPAKKEKAGLASDLFAFQVRKNQTE